MPDTKGFAVLPTIATILAGAFSIAVAPSVRAEDFPWGEVPLAYFTVQQEPGQDERLVEGQTLRLHPETQSQGPSELLDHEWFGIDPAPPASGVQIAELIARLGGRGNGTCELDWTFQWEVRQDGSGEINRRVRRVGATLQAGSIGDAIRVASEARPIELEVAAIYREPWGHEVWLESRRFPDFISIRCNLTGELTPRALQAVAGVLGRFAHSPRTQIRPLETPRVSQEDETPILREAPPELGDFVHPSGRAARAY